MKNFCLILSLFFTGSIVGQYDIENEAKLESASLTYYAKNITTGEVISTFQESKCLAPASVLKLFSTSTALNTLGSQYRFSSIIYLEGEISNNVLKGSLIIDPNYNASLGSTRLKMDISQFSATLKRVLDSLNIKTITGNVKVLSAVSNPSTIPRTWIWEDIGNYFGASSSTILDENIYKLYLSSAGTGSKSKVVKSIPSLPWITFKNNVLASNINRDLAYCFSRPGDQEVSLEGSIPANRKSFLVKAAIPNPPLTVSYIVHKQLSDLGISILRGYQVVRELPENSKKALVVQGATLAKVVRETNMNSINVWAEAVLNNAYRSSGSTATDKMKWFKTVLGKSINTNGIRLFDACGLSRFNAVSSEQTVSLIASMKKGIHWKGFEKSLATAGQTGTFKNLLKNTVLTGNLKGKSGYMNGVKSYAGIFTNAKDESIVFSIIVNNYTISNSAMKKMMERWMLSLY